MTTNVATIAHSGMPGSFGDRVRHSKALIPSLAVMLVAVAALSAALFVKRTQAGSGVPQAMQAVPANTLALAPSGGTHAKLANRAPQSQHQAVTVAVANCTNCGVVDSVQAVQRTGKASGVGVVGGAVVGGLLGNQVGGGNGRTLATVLGAVGGGYAGNTIEKNMNKVTVYQVRVRMDDGTTRMLEQGSPVAAGSRVVVDGSTVRLAATAS